MDLPMNNSMHFGNTNELTESAIDLRKLATISAVSGGQRPLFALHKLSIHQQTNECSSAADLQLKRRQYFETVFNGAVKKPKLDQPITAAREETPRNDLERPTVQTPPTVAVIKAEPISNVNTSNTLNAGVFHMSISATSLNVKQEPMDEANVTSSVTNIEDNLEESPYVQIGPHGTRVSKVNLASIDWKEASLATRKLMTFLFDRQTLATHTLSGKPSPAFRDRELKAQLDPLIVADIKHYVKQKINCRERDIRSAITLKCADTAKAIRGKSLAKMKLETSL